MATVKRIDSSNTMRIAVIAALLLGTFSSIAQGNVLLHLSLDGEARVVRPEVPAGLSGVYYPTSDADQDKAEFSDPAQYRVTGHRGRALRFRRDLQSRAEFPEWHLGKSETQLCVRLRIKPARHHIGVLASCKTDSDTNGFALFLWGNRLRFQFGDGTASQSVEGKAAFYTGKWRQVEARFDAGLVTLFLDGREIAREQTTMTQVTPGKRGLFLGAYPISGRGRKAYAYDGDLDDIVVSRRPHESSSETPADAVAPAPAIEVLAEPITGNEQHFGKSVFHTFHGHPVPLSFLFRGDPNRCRQPSFILYLPVGIRVREAFSSNHNGLDQVVTFARRQVTPKLVRLESQSYDLTHGLATRYGKGEILTIALDTEPGEVRKAELGWAIVNDGHEGPRQCVQIRFLPPPADDYEKGEFEIMAWSFADDMAFFDPELFQDVAQLYRSSGIWGKGRWYAGDHNSRPRRAALDLLLRKQGFTLYDVSLWHGPIGNKPTDEVPSATMRKGGKPDPRHLCPTAMLASETFRRQYEEHVKKRLCPPQQGDWVAIDFEPWGLPTKICYCDRCLDRFRNAAKLPENVDNQQLRKKIWDYQDEWARFWTRTTADITGMMAAAARKVDPRLRIVDYTYAFEYESPTLMRRFWSIPKDPRFVEEVVDESMLSFYHLNDRKAFDMLALNLRHLRKPVSVIVSLSRANAAQGSYTTPEESLSPQRLKQKVLLCAAQGVRKVNLFPGRYIDGMHHQAMGEASRLVWTHERFYFQGQRSDDTIALTFESGVVPTQDVVAHTVWSAGTESLLTLFNFSGDPITIVTHITAPVTSINASDGQPVVVDVPKKTATITLQPHGTRLVMVRH